MINKEIKQCVDRFVKALNPKTVYLFGSYERGDYNENSDYDFYIVLPGDTKVGCPVTTKAYSCLRNLKRKPVDIVVNNEKIFNERSSYLSTLEKTVTIEGVKVYESQ